MLRRIRKNTKYALPPPQLPLIRSSGLKTARGLELEYEGDKNGGQSYWSVVLYILLLVVSMDLPPTGPSVVHGLKPSRVSVLVRHNALKMWFDDLF